MTKLLTILLIIFCIGCEDNSCKTSPKEDIVWVSTGMDLPMAVEAFKQQDWKEAIIPYEPQYPYKYYEALTDNQGIVLVLLHDQKKILKIEYSDNNSSKPSKSIQNYKIKK